MYSRFGDICVERFRSVPLSLGKEKGDKRYDLATSGAMQILTAQARLPLASAVLTDLVARTDQVVLAISFLIRSRKDDLVVGSGRGGVLRYRTCSFLSYYAFCSGDLEGSSASFSGLRDRSLTAAVDGEIVTLLALLLVQATSLTKFEEQRGLCDFLPPFLTHLYVTSNRVAVRRFLRSGSPSIEDCRSGR